MNTAFTLCVGWTTPAVGTNPPTGGGATRGRAGVAGDVGIGGMPPGVIGIWGGVCPLGGVMPLGGVPENDNQSIKTW